MMNFRDAVYALVQEIPPGRVMTYGQIAMLLGVARAARVVGTAMRFTPDPVEIPWWRVVNAQGGVSIGWPEGADEQRQRLESEGLTFSAEGFLDLEACRWWPDDALMAGLRVDAESAALVRDVRIEGEGRPARRKRR